MNTDIKIDQVELNLQQEKLPVKKSSRELGIEILRILAMFLIICQHFINHGGFLKNAGDYTFFLNLTNVLFSPAVNVFVLISGYFSINSKFKIKKCLSLWLQVFFFSILMLLISSLFDVSISDNYVYQSLTPVISKIYWFFSAYILLYLTTPYLVAMLNAITRKQFTWLVIGIFICSYISTRFNISSIFSLSYGYTFLWFCMLFIIGAYLKKYPIKAKKIPIFIIYAFTIIIQLIFKYHFKDTSILLNKLIFNSTDYNQPLVLISSICLILLFLGIKNNGGRVHKIIAFISSCTFGVYLFHEAPMFRKVLYNQIFTTSEYWGLPHAIVYVILFALATFAMGVVLESIRMLLFKAIEKLIHCFIMLDKKERQ